MSWLPITAASTLVPVFPAITCCIPVLRSNTKSVQKWSLIPNQVHDALLHLLTRVRITSRGGFSYSCILIRYIFDMGNGTNSCIKVCYLFKGQQLPFISSWVQFLFKSARLLVPSAFPHTQGPPRKRHVLSHLDEWIDFDLRGVWVSLSTWEMYNPIWNHPNVLMVSLDAMCNWCARLETCTYYQFYFMISDII